jgi:hypothetical protein
MLSRQDVVEMRVLVTRVQAGSGSREDWSNLAALTLIWQGDAVITAIAAGGYDTFLSTIEPVYACHGFHTDDYLRIYARVCAAADRAARAPRVH